jgi:DNA-binding GntR family transcriptional regulator
MSESAIAKLLNARRTPIRESFVKYAKDGLIEIFSKSGSRVTLIDIDQDDHNCIVEMTTNADASGVDGAVEKQMTRY